MRRPFRWFLLGAGVLAACGPSVTEYCAAGTPECSPVDAAVGDTAPDDRIEAEVVDAALDGGREAEVAPACDPTKSPHDEPCAVDTAFGIFVSPAGSDTDPGSKSAPVRSIGRAMDLAKTAGKRVYVCAGSYPEQLVVGSSRDGVNVYGALDCATWSYSAASKVRVAPALSEYALAIQGLQTGVTFEDLEFDAQNAPAVVPGASSVAVFVSSSQRLRFDRVVMLAGHGTDGAPAGSTIATNWFGAPPAYAELNGNNAEDAGGAPSKPCTCADQSQTSGGAGGGPMNIPSPGAGTPGYSDAGAGAGGINALSCATGGTGQNGGDAPVPTANIATVSQGSCSPSGCLPGNGSAGDNGKPGQGGGGGGNGRLSRGSGGAGACGGCGGAGGIGGQGGGGSIALLSFHSMIAFANCTLAATAAGNGGAGGAAEAGQAGGIMGGNGALGGCAGGAGGAGAGGNGGQGGPGGSSVGIAYMGAPPTVDGVVFTQASSVSGISVGGAGAGGAGGLRGASAANSTGLAGAVGAPGQAGVAAAVGAVP
ncbi:MAG: DUF1565 domain-containing protein [Myxococcota bacterium]|nr:DUF1565 domain-containing protein [Myxococcota bacterium]